MRLCAVVLLHPAAWGPAAWFQPAFKDRYTVSRDAATPPGLSLWGMGPWARSHLGGAQEASVSNMTEAKVKKTTAGPRGLGQAWRNSRRLAYLVRTSRYLSFAAPPFAFLSGVAKNGTPITSACWALSLQGGQVAQASYIVGTVCDPPAGLKAEWTHRSRPHVCIH